MCGEKLKFGTNVTKNPGSPPRVRGKEAPGRLCSDGRGITPAYAGKSFPTGCNSSLAQDHPRVCGEKRPELFKLPLRLGSPPRMRGKVPAYQVPNPNARITPACAGKRRVEPDCSAVHWDHPRVCGEKALLVLYPVLLVGSPPRVRGKESRPHRSSGSSGITPACAGKSGTTRRKAGNKWDHPRVCGEKRRDRLDYYVPQGSPPRMRGKGTLTNTLNTVSGITPACAGKRRKAS